MVQVNNSTKIAVNKVKIEFTNKEITAYGGLSVLAKFFEKIGLRKRIEEAVPIKETSPNAVEIYGKIIGFTLTVLAGGERFTHLLYLGSPKALTEVFGLKKLPLASTTLTRFFNKIKSLYLVEILSDKLWVYLSELIRWGEIKEDWLTFDSTVLERYGFQEGAKKGYNPKKKGRPCHNPLMAFLNRSGYIIHLWNRRGDVCSCNNIHDFFKVAIARIAERIKIIGVIADSGFYEKKFIEELEAAKKIYIIAARLYNTLQEKIYNLETWRKIDEGIEVSEFYYCHKDWGQERRYIVIRQDIGIREAATGKQLSLFPEEDDRRYRYSVWVTNSEAEASEVWNLCKPRGNDENIIKALKEDFALGGFCLKKFYATESAMLIRVFIYNLFVIFRNDIMEQTEKKERLKTIRYKYFVLPSLFGQRGNNFVLRISAKSQKLRDKLTRFFHNIQQYVTPFPINCNAVENFDEKASGLT